MAKKVHYYGANTIIKAHPEGGGKVRRTKLGALQIEALEFAANPPPMFPLFPEKVDGPRLITKPTKRRRKRPARIVE